MKVLVTGGAGFQGSNLCQSLLVRGDAVTILNTPSDVSRDNLRYFNLSTATIVWGSVTDEELVRKTVRDHDLVFHLAANIHVDESRKRPDSYVQTNVVGTYNVIQACMENNIPLIHVSTCEVYGGCGGCDEQDDCAELIAESCSLKPQSPYAASKAGADCLVYSYGKTYGTPVLIVRPGNVFGPGQRAGDRGAVIPRFIFQALGDKPITIYGDGSQARDFVYVKDLVRAYLFLADRFLNHKIGEPPQVFNAGTGRDVSIAHLAEMIVRYTGSSSRIVHSEARPGEVKSFRLDSSKLLSLGFKWLRTFEEGLSEYMQEGICG